MTQTHTDVPFRTTMAKLCAPYFKNCTRGSFVLIDEATGVTVGAGMMIARIQG